MKCLGNTVDTLFKIVKPRCDRKAVTMKPLSYHYLNKTCTMNIPINMPM